MEWRRAGPIKHTFSRKSHRHHAPSEIKAPTFFKGAEHAITLFFFPRTALHHPFIDHLSIHLYTPVVHIDHAFSLNQYPSFIVGPISSPAQTLAPFKRQRENLSAREMDSWTTGNVVDSKVEALASADMMYLAYSMV